MISTETSKREPARGNRGHVLPKKIDFNYSQVPENAFEIPVEYYSHYNTRLQINQESKDFP